MKRLQFLLALPAAALGMTPGAKKEDHLSEAAKEVARKFTVPLEVEGKKLRKVFYRPELGITAYFFFDDFQVEVNRFVYKNRDVHDWWSAQVRSNTSPIYFSKSSSKGENNGIVKNVISEFLKCESIFKQI